MITNFNKHLNEEWDDVEDQIKFNKREFDRNDKNYKNDKEISYFINKYKNYDDADIITIADKVLYKSTPSEYLALSHIAHERGLSIDGIHSIDINDEVPEKDYSYIKNINNKSLYVESKNNNNKMITKFNDYVNEGLKDTIKNFINPSEEKKIEKMEKTIEGLTQKINKMDKLINNPDDFIDDDPIMEYAFYCFIIIEKIKEMKKTAEGIEEAEKILVKFIKIAINKIVSTFPEDVTKYNIDSYTKKRIKEMLMDVDDICQDYNINFFKNKGIKI